MTTISVITPVYAPNPEYLLAAYQSVASQQLPAGWDWQWVVQEDGRSGIAADILPNDPRIAHGTGRRGGVAITRNLALARAQGTLIKNLDQDDQLTPGTLARDIMILSRETGVGWTTSRVLDLLPDGSTVGFDHDPAEGPLTPTDVIDNWRAHHYRLPVHPTTICIRRPLAVALGGWMAVPGSDDTGLLVAASVISLGYFIATVGLLYRKHPDQASQQTDHTDTVEWAARMSLIDERAHALSTLVQLHDRE